MLSGGSAIGGLLVDSPFLLFFGEEFGCLRIVLKEKIG
jgi:hypothetical protein